MKYRRIDTLLRYWSTPTRGLRADEKEELFNLLAQFYVKVRDQLA